jgi:hypothetical protein
MHISAISGGFFEALANARAPEDEVRVMPLGGKALTARDVEQRHIGILGVG